MGLPSPRGFERRYEIIQVLAVSVHRVIFDGAIAFYQFSPERRQRRPATVGTARRKGITKAIVHVIGQEPPSALVGAVGHVAPDLDVSAYWLP